MTWEHSRPTLRDTDCSSFMCEQHGGVPVVTHKLFCRSYKTTAVKICSLFLSTIKTRCGIGDIVVKYKPFRRAILCNVDFEMKSFSAKHKSDWWLTYLFLFCFSTIGNALTQASQTDLIYLVSNLLVTSSTNKKQLLQYRTRRTTGLYAYQVFFGAGAKRLCCLQPVAYPPLIQSLLHQTSQLLYPSTDIIFSVSS